MRRDELRLPLPPNNDRPGDRWMCGRRGGQQPCLRGPSDRGVCPMEPACQVRRSWYGRRRRALLIATLILLGILLFMMRSPHQLAIIKPGNLSNPHAQILAGTITSQRCAACHPQATDPDKTWFNGSSEGHQQVTQTDACLDCHHKTMPRSVAKLAHNLNAEQLAELKNHGPGWLLFPVVPRRGRICYRVRPSSLITFAAPPAIVNTTVPQRTFWPFLTCNVRPVTPTDLAALRHRIPTGMTGHMVAGETFLSITRPTPTSTFLLIDMRATANLSNVDSATNAMPKTKSHAQPAIKPAVQHATKKR